MKSKYFALASAIMLAVATSPAIAGHDGDHKERHHEEHHEGHHEGHHKRHHGGYHGKGSFIQRYDQNDDAQVTADEFEQARRARYDLTDENGNGLVDVDEYVQEYANRLDKKIEKMRKKKLKWAKKRFGKLDKDENGEISFEEYQASGQKMFSRHDTNEDGVVSESDPKSKKCHKGKHKHGEGHEGHSEKSKNEHNH